ncbi:Uncharacterized protein OS=Rhodopirellula maiorica SM1 GN=RMSM_00800 PE=4 SV=1 [Gemmata massiliana]|uniref:Uncharacterized protein n=1 Tax=Gemmata massiliana TaxID=1210884 RepID=A0A6P2D8N9_9BACT|nr:hypothetical protein [Gemmata massiliana]VTR97303.1 Uncharacterized protein OS=Rhodopirellula maiorica SM1 GN=RMSM_00800 PE=4 SV=1 [Gemmata massiliana]
MPAPSRRIDPILKDNSQQLKEPNKPAVTDITRRLNEASETLAARYDALNEQYIRAEVRLKSLKPISDCWIKYNIEESPGEPHIRCWDLIGLVKLEGKWRLVHATDSDHNNELPFGIKPLVECPAEVRVHAAAEIRRLHEKIIRRKEQHIPEVDAAIAEVKSYCDEI